MFKAKGIHVCEFCGKTFQGYRYRPNKFCSKKCSSTRNRRLNLFTKPKKGIWKNCLQCSKEFYVYKCKIEEKKFCSRTCQYEFLRKNEAWGFKRNGSPMPNNPYKRISIKGKWHSEHRLIIEANLGRKLEKWEHIHHINGNPQDNRLENLQVLSASDHLKLHKS